MQQENTETKQDGFAYRSMEQECVGELSCSSRWVGSGGGYLITDFKEEKMEMCRNGQCWVLHRNLDLPAKPMSEECRIMSGMHAASTSTEQNGVREAVWTDQSVILDTAAMSWMSGKYTVTENGVEFR